SHYRLAVVVRNTGALAGYVGLFNIDYDRRDGEIGFFIAPRLQGNGYASEAADNLVKAAQQIGLDNVYATAREDNAASRRIIEKLGMQKESVIPNKYHDNVSTRLLFRRRLRNGPSL
ncbi:MAG TPA: GNAT family N-acetyltransferase, partial [Micavibrio sp.]